jgi:hypothetical protein
VARRLVPPREFGISYGPASPWTDRSQAKKKQKKNRPRAEALLKPVRMPISYLLQSFLCGDVCLLGFFDVCSKAPLQQARIDLLLRAGNSGRYIISFPFHNLGC